MKRVLIFASLSALSAYGCLLAAATGLVTLLINWHLSLVLISIAIPLAVTAGIFERLKLRALYGPAMGNVLHTSRATTGGDFALRDLLAYRVQRHSLTPSCHAPGHNAVIAPHRRDHTVDCNLRH